MKSKARISDHPLHPMLIVIPAGTFITALVFDIVYITTGNETWWEATAPLILIGVIGAVIAAIPGLIDLFGVAQHQNARGIGLTHMVLNLVVVALFIWNDVLRWDAETAPAAGQTYGGFWLSLLGVGILGVSGWLGWKMVYEYHVGVLEHPEAKDPEPPTLRERPAAD